jgi:protein-L-isoaspartate(D-aspartate) O-methyltransferase
LNLARTEQIFPFEKGISQCVPSEYTHKHIFIQVKEQSTEHLPTMAWHSSGATNDELVDNLIENGLISSDIAAEAFRNVDRIHFVPKGCEEVAYDDRPLKANKNVHISAPHIYCTVLDSLDLEPNSTSSFLNIGVGTGYLSCIVASILGKKSHCYGVDIHNDVIQHCESAIESWKESFGEEHAKLVNFHGNGLNILDQGESSLGFDRIYVGAAIEKEDFESLKGMLAEDGILVAPVDDCLTKVVRTKHTFSAQTISGVHFAPLLQTPEKSVLIPAMKWSTTNYHLYPPSFQSAAMTLLMCSNSKLIQIPKMDAPVARTNIAATLPNHVWLHIISFANRKWFDPQFCEVERLKKRLRMEQSLSSELESQNRLLRGTQAILQHERDLYSSLIRRIRTEIQGAIHQGEGNNVGSQDALYNTTQMLLDEANIILGYYHTSEVEVESNNMEVDQNDEDASSEWEVEVDMSISMPIDAQTGESEHDPQVPSRRTVSFAVDDL